LRIWDLICGIWDVEYGLPFTVYRLRLERFQRLERKDLSEKA
jgi:hypothetical protein